jgi:ubiquinone/menaquinone biosynthesis C-methylase UbiE
VGTKSARKPGKGDVSRPDPRADYREKKRFYQDPEVAGDYDFHRFGSTERVRRNARKWKAISRALARATGIRSVLDLPCGTGRFTGRLADAGYDVVGADISSAMMREARLRFESRRGIHGYVRADAEHLPLADGSVDCVMSIRFLHHIDPPTRVVILRELARVSRRWLVLDFRHKASYRYLISRLRARLGFPSRRPTPQVSKREMDAELAAAGVRAVAMFPVARFFSDKCIVLGETGGGA